MGKVYFIYATIPEKIFNTRIKYFLPQSSLHRFKRKHGAMYGLYAWTTKKKHLKLFLETRDPSVYTVVEKDLDKDDEEFEYIRRDIKEHELNKYEYITNSDDGEEEEDETISQQCDELNIMFQRIKDFISEMKLKSTKKREHFGHKGDLFSLSIIVRIIQTFRLFCRGTFGL